jgi:HEPN domain-containing protein
MTADELARSYFLRCRKRRVALEALFGVDAYADVMREAQELVELGLKGLLRSTGIDPPKWHDVGKIMLDNAELFSAELQPDLQRMADISARLRKERELSFYGEIDFIPEENYSREDAVIVMAEVDWILERLPES